jgi:hypothetical protein
MLYSRLIDRRWRTREEGIIRSERNSSDTIAYLDWITCCSLTDEYPTTIIIRNISVPQVNPDLSILNATTIAHNEHPLILQVLWICRIGILTSKRKTPNFYTTPCFSRKFSCPDCSTVDDQLCTGFNDQAGTWVKLKSALNSQRFAGRYHEILKEFVAPSKRSRTIQYERNRIIPPSTRPN